MAILDVANIIQSNAVVYYAPVGTAEVARTLAWGATWPAPWQRIGYTSAPLTVGYGFDKLELEVQEAVGAVRRSKQNEELRLETVMAEIDLSLMPLAWGGTNTNTPAASGASGYQTYDMGGDSYLQERIWAFEGRWVRPSDNAVLPIRAYFWRATAQDGGEQEWSKNAYVGTPINIGALADLNRPVGQRLMRIVRITDPALA